MSFYFEVETDVVVPTSEILERLGHKGVVEYTPDPATIVFCIPGQSLRGCCLYRNENGYSIGVNAFTPSVDARLARDIAAVIGAIADAPVLPEDREDALPAAEIANYGGEGWVKDRFHEARSIALLDKDPDAPMTIFGYKRAFAVSRTMITVDGKPDEKAIRRTMQIGAELQCIDDHEDIHAASLISLSAAPRKAGLFRRLLGFGSKSAQSAATAYAAFAIGPEIRTLTPWNSTQDPLFALLRDAKGRYRRLPAETLFRFAEEKGARSYGIGVYDLTVEGSDYSELCILAEPM